ncbi:MAG TPA: class I SAM-dependent methyltransferase [Candidatus Hydrogenedentes bacterium]|nr:class I SAM-dependent methyltransferase [Candidatus Hydrogenedentota bacterium]HOL76182.1 class I SAM-dependent methyltransferase [Candidatus Hydrogenedentota bacterium]HPO84797.1 class I SAM-dependent methyltransferase [Candidatus Hydrogenedentota bacterium]
MNIPVIEELCAFTGLPEEEVWLRLDAGIGGTAESFRKEPDEERWYRETDAYLFELANYDESPLLDSLAGLMARLMKDKSKRVLDYGCGIGTFALMLAQKGLLVTACDINKNNEAFLRFRVARRGFSEAIEVVDPETALNRPNYYAMISCQHVLEHVPDPRALLKRMKDALIVSGIFWGVAPFDLVGELFPEHRPELANLKLEDLCQEVGLLHVQSEPFGGLDNYQFILVAAVKAESDT